MGLAIIVLAAGEGTRMKSSKPKVLHEICQTPMIDFVLDTARALNPDRIVVIVGHGADAVRRVVDRDDVEFVLQTEQLGTGHAVSMTEDLLEGFSGTAIVLSGDTPLIQESTLRNLLDQHKSAKAAATLLTAKLDDPTGYGRIIRSESGLVMEIVEQKDATPEQLAVKEVNSGTYCFDKQKLFDALKNVGSDNAQGEQYLTDVIGIFKSNGETIAASIAGDFNEIMGVNTRVQLSEADLVMRYRINKAHMLNGVTIIDPLSTYISKDVKIARDTTVYPMTFISGDTIIGESCSIGPSSTIENSKFEDSVRIENSIVRECIIERGATLGPYCHLRPGTLVRAGAKVGGFVEVKKSEIGVNSKVPHLSYIGDTVIGEDVNIGAGTITCNYDGANKYKTVVEDGAFVGSDSMLVAPVRIGKGSFTAAGSVITKDVPEDALSVERNEQVIIEHWAKKRREKKGKLEGGPDD
jgi:bifunctional UDP-N-acetylglucosamine pyrophosphorylase/glucosamine-1-phosphate N-acetyltransferase